MNEFLYKDSLFSGERTRKVMDASKVAAPISPFESEMLFIIVTIGLI